MLGMTGAELGLVRSWAEKRARLSVNEGRGSPVLQERRKVGVLDFLACPKLRMYWS